MNSQELEDSASIPHHQIKEKQKITELKQTVPTQRKPPHELRCKET